MIEHVCWCGFTAASPGGLASHARAHARRGETMVTECSQGEVETTLTDPVMYGDHPLKEDHGETGAPSEEREGGPEPARSGEPIPQASEPPITDEELITRIMADPLLGPVFATVRELDRKLDASIAEILAIVDDQNDAIDTIAKLPPESDLMASFDRFVETYNLQDQVKGLLRAGEAALLSVAGAAPGMPELGADFVDEMKATYRLTQEKRQAVYDKVDAALDRGDEIILLDRDELDKARREGFLKDDKDESE